MFRARTLSLYVMVDLLRAFVMSLTVITVIFVLLVAVAEAIKQDLGLRQIVRFVPLVVPITLPYTVPAAVLFATSVVFGRLAADNEILAIKCSGVSPVGDLPPAEKPVATQASSSHNLWGL